MKARPGFDPLLGVEVRGGGRAPAARRHRVSSGVPESNRICPQLSTVEELSRKRPNKDQIYLFAESSRAVNMQKRRFCRRFLMMRFDFYPMSERQEGPYDTIARKWLALAERRQQYLIELSTNGRWRLYFSQVELEAEMRKAALTRDQWARVVRLLCGDTPERLAS